MESQEFLGVEFQFIFRCFKFSLYAKFGNSEECDMWLSRGLFFFHLKIYSFFYYIRRFKCLAIFAYIRDMYILAISLMWISIHVDIKQFSWNQRIHWKEFERICTS